MKQIITADRVRALLDGTRTEADATAILRRHRIRYHYSTAGGVLHIRIPARTGIITVTRTASRLAPFVVSSAVPGTVRPYLFPLTLYRDD
jgi:hypothetical protein